MNKDMKLFLSILAAIFIAGGAFTYGALTAPQSQPAPTTTTTPQPSVSTKPTASQLKEKLQSELPTILSVMTAAYPKIATDYTVNTGQLFDEGQWFGTTLTYRGSDSDNRDTLRVLLQKKNGVWTLRTTPPRLILSAKEFPDVPKSILQTINKPISLPAGSSNSPAISATE